jgi:hypothetical protein
MILCSPRSVKRNSKLFRALLHFLAFVAVAVPAFAQVYKWVDERGVTHYGERPPQGRKSSEVPHKLGTPPAPAGPARESMPQQDRSPQQGQVPPQDQESRQGQAQVTPPSDKQAQEAQRRQEQCNQQRDLLARLRQSAPGSASSGWGPSAPPATEQSAAIARQEKLVAEQCRS